MNLDKTGGLPEDGMSQQPAEGPPVPVPQVTEYTVCILPEDDVNAGAYAIKVAYRGAGRWAVMRSGFCLSTGGAWEHECGVSSRTDGWLDRHRFDLETALRLAVEYAPRIAVLGVTAAEALRKATERQRERNDDESR